MNCNTTHYRANSSSVPGDPTALFHLAVLLSAHFGGLGPGLLATALSSAVVQLLFLGPTHSYRASAALDVTRQMIFIGTGVLISLLSEKQRRSRNSAAKSLVELQRQRQWARVTLASIGDGVIASDSEGRVTFLNDIAQDLTGFTQPEASGRPLAEVFHLVDEETRASIESPAEKALRDGGITSLTESARLVAKDGTSVPVESSGAPIRDKDGRVQGVVLVFRDVADRMRAEKERADLYAAERAARADAEHASRMKDEFLATLSHELRTPLNAILGWSQLLRTARMEAKDISRGLEVIERNCRAQTRLVEDLLDMSRIISGKARLDVRPVELFAIIDAAVEAVRPAAQAKSIRIERNLDPDGGSVNGDPARLQQIIWNLLSNAIKFTPSGGSVELALRRVDLEVELTVSDTGQGIAPDFLPHVFERFRQADSSVTRVHSGLGLGLAIVRHLVELHGGTIRAASDGNGRGAAFIVRLPTGPERPLGEPAPDRSPPSEPASPKAYRPPPLDGLRVLLVDDDQDARDLGARILTEHQAEVLVASSASEALDVVARERLDVLVSDIGMPGEDGYTLIGKVRALGEARGGMVPAIAVTAFARPDDRRRALLAGFQLHLPKPIDPIELTAAVAALAGRTGRNLRRK